jgi:Holliday junction resolvase RusA-like endonuclease
MTRTSSKPAWSAVLAFPPVPAARPRVTRQGWSYYPKTYKTWLQRATEGFAEQKPATPIEGPVAVRLFIYAERPKTTKRLFPRGDVDNFAKAVFDAATKGGVWVDDDQIVKATITKRFDAVNPRVVLEVTEANPEEHA